MTAVGKWVRKVFGIDSGASGRAAAETGTTVSDPPASAINATPAEQAAERAARTAADAAHIQSQEASRRRIKAESASTAFAMPKDASSFLANRGTRYSGLKLTLGG